MMRLLVPAVACIAIAATEALTTFPVPIVTGLAPVVVLNEVSKAPNAVYRHKPLAPTRTRPELSTAMELVVPAPLIVSDVAPVLASFLTVLPYAT
jgi:hypothetical protein